MQNYKQLIRQTVVNRQQQLVLAQTLYANLNENKAFFDNECALRKAVYQNKTELVVLLKKKQALLLKNMGYDMDALSPPPSCHACNDKGFDDSGKICNCIIKKASAEFFANNTNLQQLRFDDIDMSFYKDNSQTVQQLIHRLQIFCDKFPDTNARSIVLSGNTGTGKTHLLGCIANKLLQKGTSVLFVTAFRFVQSMTKYHTTFDDTKGSLIAPFLDCDLLIIDDLGTESIFNNITLEYLYLVLSERFLQKKHILISTNLEKHDIESRYGMRIASRLYDKNLYFGHRLLGTDNRIIG